MHYKFYSIKFAGKVLVTFFECSEKPSQTKIIYSPIGDFSGNLADFFTGKMLKSISNPSIGNEK